MKKNTLLEELSSLDPKTFVYIGAKHGSGWIFMDTAENVLRDLDTKDKILYDKARCLLINAENLLLTQPKRMIDLMKKIDKEKDDDKKKELLNHLNELQGSFAASFKTKRQYERILFDWTELKNRKVVEEYNHSTSPEGIAFIVDGYDRSEYCFYEEQFEKEEKVA